MNYDAVTQYVMCPPSTFTAAEANNIFMEKIPDELRVVDHNKALSQWLELYRYIAARKPVNLLPALGENQDLVFCSNIGVSLESSPGTVVVSNFRSRPRRGETPIGYDFFRTLGYHTVICPYLFEGKADLHQVAGNVYAGAYGMRTSSLALQWFEEEFGIEVIPVRITNPYLYHLDCSLFSLDDQTLLLITDGVDRETIRRLEEFVNIVGVSAELGLSGVTNAIRVDDTILIGAVPDRRPEDREVVRLWERVCYRANLNLKVFDLTEFEKGGGALSCLVMPLFEPL